MLHDHHALTGQVASNQLPDVPIRQPMCTASFLGIKQVVVLLAPSSHMHFGGAVWFWAHPKCTVLVAEPVRDGGGGTIGCMATFESGSTVLLAESSCVCFGGAARMDAHRPCTTTVLGAKSSCVYFGGAAWMDAHSL